MVEAKVEWQVPVPVLMNSILWLETIMFIKLCVWATLINKNTASALYIEQDDTNEHDRNSVDN